MELENICVSGESIDVFISHAGPDKVFIARPLSNKLQALGLNCFLDRRSMEPGDHGPNEMTQAMNSAKVGVFILSPEFAARKWTMRELRCFLRRRREAANTGTPPPILIPVFYRLSIAECRGLQPERYEDDEAKNIFEVEKFYSDERQREATTEDVKSELRELADLTGIENLDKATNSLHDEFAHDLRGNLVERISKWVKQKCEEQGHHRVRSGSTSPAGGTASVTGAVCDARGQQGDSRSVRNESAREEFVPSFDVPENPTDVILKFGQRAEIGTETGMDTAPEEQLRKKLLGVDGPQSVGAVGGGSRKTAGMKGMGGIGKSCALRGLAVDADIRKKFCDGIYWLILGQDATKRGMVKQLARITRESGGRLEAREAREESELDSAISLVKKWFKGRTILLLIDDVWRDAEVGSCAVTRLQEIADTEKGSCMAFTAREWGLVTGSEEIKFSLKDYASSLEIVMKSAAIRKEEIEGLENEMRKILKFCDGHPLALSVVSKAIKSHREFADELGLKDVFEEYLEELEDSPSCILDKRVDGYIYKNLASAFSASLSMMDRNKARGDVYPMPYAEMYESLVVIRRQGWLPLTVICALWGLSGEVKARRVLREFIEASLVERKDRVGSDGQRTVGVRLHDLQLDYVQRRCEREGEGEGEKKWHRKVVQEWEWKGVESTQGVAWVCGRKWKSDIAGDEYFRDNLCRHLKGAELKDELCNVLSDPRWAAERLTRGEGLGLQEDFKIFMSMGEEERGFEEGGTVWSLRKIAREARLSASYVVRHSREVWFQLYDRLLRFTNKSDLIREYLCTIEKVAERPWLKSLTPRTNASDAVQDIFVDQGRIEGMSGCAEKNEVTAWGRDREHLFCRTFWNGEVKKNVTCEVPEDMRSIWSQNGKYVAAVRCESDVQVWDMHTGGTAQRFGREFNLGNDSDDGDRGDGKDRDRAANEKRIAFWGGGYSFRNRRCWDLTGDGKRLVLGEEGGKVMLWAVETGRKIKEVTSGRGDYVREVSFSPDGKRLMSAGNRGSYLILDGETGERIGEYNLPEMDIYESSSNSRIWWSRNGTRVACHSEMYRRTLAETPLLIFNGETGEQIGYEKTTLHQCLYCCIWSHDEKQLWCSWDGQFCVWDEGSGKKINEVKKSRGRNPSKMYLTGDQRWVAVSSRRLVSPGLSFFYSRNSISVFDAETGAEVWSDKEQHRANVEFVGWLQDGRRMFSADWSGKIVIWEWDNLETVREEKTTKKDRWVTATAWSSDDTCVAAVGEDGDVFVYDVKTGNVVWKDDETHVSAVYCLEISGDNMQVFSGAKDGKVATWNMTTGEKLWEAWINMRDERGYIKACWSNDAMRVLVLNADSMTMWDGKAGHKLWERITDSWIKSVAWCGDDTKIACLDSSRNVVVRGSRTGLTVAVKHLAGCLYCVNCELVKWSPDGKWTATSGSTYGGNGRVMKVVIWNYETGVTIWSPEQSQESHVPCLEWSHDGRHIAYGYDKLVIWNIATGQAVIEQESGDPFNYIAWSQDGSHLAALSCYGMLRIADVTSQAIVEVYDDVACFDQSSLRQLLDAKEGKLSPDLERRLKIRRKRDGVFHTAGDEVIRLATTADGEWHWSTSCRHIAISKSRHGPLSGNEMECEVYFYELVE